MGHMWSASGKGKEKIDDKSLSRPHVMREQLGEEFTLEQSPSVGKISGLMSKTQESVIKAKFYFCRGVCN
jgi:hypothetical protein